MDLDWAKQNLKALVVAFFAFVVVGNLPAFEGYGIVAVAAGAAAFFLAQRYLADF